MGQKTNPKAFRLVTTENHLSSWYSNKHFYSKAIKEDFLARTKTQQILQDFLTLSRIQILRRNAENETNHIVHIHVFALFPRAKDMYRKVISYFEKIDDISVKRALNLLIAKKARLTPFVNLLIRLLARDIVQDLQRKTNNLYKISIHFIKNVFEDARLISKYIASQLEKRMPFRRVMKQCIKKAMLTPIKGIKIEVSGRLNGIDIARSEWKRKGKIPLHTLKAKIDYVKEEAQTIYGVIGIKVWIFIK